MSKRQGLAIAFIVNTAFLIVEVAAAYITGSLTLLADAGHMLTDSISIGVAIGAAYLATRPSDSQRTYGYQRVEVLAGFVNGLFLLGVVAYTVWSAFVRLSTPQAVDGATVTIVGVIGLAANIVAAAAVYEHRENLNVRGAFVHLLGDALGSVAAIVAGLAIQYTGAAVFDVVAALVVAVIILYSTISLLRDSTNILLQGAPRAVSPDEVHSLLMGIDDVSDVHHIHVWALNSECVAISAHVVTTEEKRTAVMQASQAALRDALPIAHATLQVESEASVTDDHDTECSVDASVSHTHHFDSEDISGD